MLCLSPFLSFRPFFVIVTLSCHPERSVTKSKDPTNGVLTLPMGSFDSAYATLRMTMVFRTTNKKNVLFVEQHENHTIQN
jgi:hypothetical protein